MVLTFTSSLNAATAGRADVAEMLMGAFGCNIAWGIIDAILYLLGLTGERALDARSVRALRELNPVQGRALVADAILSADRRSPEPRRP